MLVHDQLAVLLQCRCYLVAAVCLSFYLLGVQGQTERVTHTHAHDLQHQHAAATLGPSVVRPPACSGASLFSMRTALGLLICAACVLHGDGGGVAWRQQRQRAGRQQYGSSI